MYDFLCAAMRRVKKHHFAAYIVGCIIFITTAILSLMFINKHLPELMQYKEIKINLFNLIKIEALR